MEIYFFKKLDDYKNIEWMHSLPGWCNSIISLFLTHLENTLYIYILKNYIYFQMPH